MMKINKNEQEFVLKYFQPGKLDTRKALQKVKARVGIADEEVSHAATVSLRMRRIRRIAVAASILVLFTIGGYTLLQPKTVTLSAESEVVAHFTNIRSRYIIALSKEQLFSYGLIL